MGTRVPRRTVLKLGAAGCATLWPLLAGAASSAHATPALRGKPPTPSRIVVLDFGLTEMLLTLGVTPLATSVPDWYRRTNVAPPLPAGVIDVGLLYQPNFELLEALRPDLFVMTPAHRPLRTMLERIAPTLTLSLFEPDSVPYQLAGVETMRLAHWLDREAAGRAALASANAALAEAHTRLSRSPQGPGITHRPLFVVEFVDARHLLVYGRASLFGDVLERLGLRNAWRHETNARGAAVIDFSRLADVPDAQLVYIEPLPDAARDTVDRGVLWHSLPFVRDARVAGMPKVSAGGSLYTAGRFARQLADVLLSGSEHA